MMPNSDSGTSETCYKIVLSSKTNFGNSFIRAQNRSLLVSYTLIKYLNITNSLGLIKTIGIVESLKLLIVILIALNRIGSSKNIYIIKRFRCRTM